MLLKEQTVAYYMKTGRVQCICRGGKMTRRQNNKGIRRRERRERRTSVGFTEVAREDRGMECSAEAGRRVSAQRCYLALSDATSIVLL